MAPHPSGFTGRNWKLNEFSGWTAYLLALIISVLWLPLYNLLFDPGHTPMILVFLLPVIFSAYVGGLGPGLLATGIVAFVTRYYLLEPQHSLLLAHSIDVARWLALILIGGVISLLTEALHRARQKAEAETLLKAVTLASIGDAVITTNQQGNVTFLNAEAERLTEWSNAEAVGQPLAKVFCIINEQTRQPVADPVKKVLQTGAVVGLANHTVMIGRNGRETPIDDSGAPIKKPDGSIIGVVLVFRDCGEQKRAEAAVRESAALYHSLVDQLPAGVFRKDAAGRYVFVNSFFCRLRQTTPDQFLGKLPAELPATEDSFKAAAMEHHAQIMHTGETIEVLDEYHRVDGQTLFFHVVKTPVYDANGKIVGSQGVLFDVTERRRTEDTLREVMAQTRCIINAGTVEGPDDWREHALDEDSHFQWNFPVQNVAAAQAMLPMELQPGQAYHQAWNHHRHLADHIQMNKNSGQALLDGAPFYRNEFRCTDRHGQEHWMQQYVTVEKIAENRWRLFGITTDVSELKQVEQRYRRERALLRALIDSIPDLIFFKDQDSVYLGGNQAFEQYTGHNSANLIGKTDWDLFPRETAEACRKMDREVMHSQKKLQVEEYIPRKNGQGCQFETLKTPYRGPDGEGLGLIAICRDITERKRTEDQLRKLSCAVEQSSVAIVITDTAGKIEYVNPKFTQTTGYTAAEAIGQNPRLLKSGETTDAEYQRLWETITAGGEWRGEFCNRKKNGELFWENTFISPIFDTAGNITHYLGIKEDITERKRLEEQLRQSQKMEAIGQLAGGIAHDFNNLLTAIHGNASLLRDMEISLSEKDECAREIVEATDRAANLTRQLLMFSRKQVMQTVNLNLNETVARMTKMLQRILGEDISLVANFAPGLPALLADAGMIEQVLLNLAVNSRDAMPGGGKLAISTSTGRPENIPNGQPDAEYICLSVADTGSGIAPENLPRIFDPFFTTKEVGQGTGLGLATVYGIMQQHHGWIEVASQLGQGTTFKLYFPVNNGPQAGKKTAMPLAQLPRGNETILVVEDEAPVRQIVEHLLQRLGYKVLSAPNGKVAQQIWAEHKVQIALLMTDVIMPEGINGFKLGQQAQAEKPGLKVIYTSGYTGNMETRPGQCIEGTNFIHKPFTPEALAEIIRKNLDLA